MGKMKVLIKHKEEVCLLEVWVDLALDVLSLLLLGWLLHTTSIPAINGIKIDHLHRRINVIFIFRFK